MIETLDAKHVDRDGLIRYWRTHPVEAAKDIFDIDLDTPQQIVMQLRWKHTNHIDILGRGSGKTLLGGLDASLSALLWPGNKIGLIAPSFRQSRFLFAEVERLYERSPIFQESCNGGPSHRPDSCVLKLKNAPGQNSSFIEALPLGTDGAKIRGARYYKIVSDEGAQIEDSILNTVIKGFAATTDKPMENVKRVAEQMKLLEAGKITQEQLDLPTGNKSILSSTAYYQYNHLWRRVTTMQEQILKEYRVAQRRGKNLDRFTLKGGPINGGQIPHRVMSNGTMGMCAFICTDMSPGFLDMSSIRQAQAEMPESQFLQEYFCFFSPDSEGFFRRSMLDAARDHRKFGVIDEPRKGMKYVFGVDPARDGDNFAIAVFEIDPVEQIIRLVRVYAYQKQPFPIMHRELRRLIHHWGVEYFKMDSGGGGTTIRDLLADKTNCPPGEPLILEQDFDEHMMKVGKHWLAPLVQFSSADWVTNTNFGLKSAIQHGRMQIAAPEGDTPGEIYQPWMDDANAEMESAMNEMASIITTATQTGNRMRFDTPTKRQRKDRYSAILMGFDAANYILERAGRPQSLAGGFWG